MTPTKKKPAEEEKNDAMDYLYHLSTNALIMLDHLDHFKTNQLDTGAEVLYRTMEAHFYETMARIEQMDYPNMKKAFDG